jgi:hypothetical protein
MDVAKQGRTISSAATLLQQYREVYAMERRLHTRHRARTVVYVTGPNGQGKLCRARNLSANGVFIETSNLGLRKGTTVQLAFAINLGVVTKIHRRTAIVAHISRGGTGLMMESMTGTR